MRLCLLHGFTQTGANWGPVAARFEQAGHDVVCPDAPGHGRRSAVRADLWEGARLLAEEVGPACWVGYSMGGRLALHVALASPDTVERLVLVSATAGITDDFARRARRRADDALATGLELQGVPAFIDHWLSLPLFETLPPDRAGIEHRLTNTVKGLASSLRLAGTGTQDVLWERLGEIRAPTLVVTGQLDERFGLLGGRLAARIPDAKLAVIGGAGHAVPWERPELFGDEVAAWLSQG